MPLTQTPAPRLHPATGPAAGLAAGLLLMLVPLAASAEEIVAREQRTEVAGTVVAINRQTRLMTLKQADGSYRVLHVPMEVRRIDGIRIGDRAALQEVTTVSIALDKTRGGKPVGAESLTIVDPTPGSKPAGTITGELIFQGKVAKVDRAAGTVTIQGPDDVQAFEIADRALLDRFAVGNGVTATIRNTISGAVK